MWHLVFDLNQERCWRCSVLQLWLGWGGAAIAQVTVGVWGGMSGSVLVVGAVAVLAEVRVEFFFFQWCVSVFVGTGSQGFCWGILPVAPV